MTQFRNSEHDDNQADEFLRRNELKHSTVQIADSMMWLNRDGGGSLLWAFDGQGPACYGRGSTSQWTENGTLDISSYEAVTGRGGPFVVLDGATDYLSIADAPWQEATTNNFLVWGWVNSNHIDVDMAIASKWDETGNLRSWKTHLASSAFTFTCNSTGVGGADSVVTSTVTPVDGAWYFVAGYLQPSILQSIGVAAAADTSLTYTANTTTPAAGVFDGVNTDLFVGALTGAVAAEEWWDGLLGVGLMRANTPADSIRSHMTRIFASTRWFYGA